MEKKLQRHTQDAALAGVCAGLGEYSGIDKTWVRIAFVLSVFLAGYGIGLLGPIIYIVLWIVLPVKQAKFTSDPFNVDYRAPAAQQNPSCNYSNPYSADFRGHTDWASTTPKASKDRYIAGFILLSVGIFFLLQQMDVLYWRDVYRYWPLLLMLFGVASIVSAFKRKGPIADVFEQAHDGDGEDLGNEKASDSNDTGEQTYTK